MRLGRRKISSWLAPTFADAKAKRAGTATSAIANRGRPLANLDGVPNEGLSPVAPAIDPLVVTSSNTPRTQNGHITNDARDVSRRVASDRKGVICSENCVADDRA